MSRLIIDVSGEQHQKIKPLAALQGKSIKDYVLNKLLPEVEDQAWEELKTILRPRIEDAENNPPTGKTFEQVTYDIIQKSKP